MKNNNDDFAFSEFDALINIELIEIEITDDEFKIMFLLMVSFCVYIY